MREWEPGSRYWIVGASEGLGRALADVMNRAGLELILSARSEERLKSLVAELPGRSLALPMDVCDADSVARAAQQAGEIDGVVYLAGAYWPMEARGWDPEKAATMIDVNLAGAARVLGHAVPAMIARRRGHVVLVGSLSGYRGLPGAIGYAASKAGLMNLAESMQADLRGSGVEVQLAVPGFIRTRLTEKNDFRMPYLMEPEEAARQVFEQMTSGAFRSSFPAPFSWLFRLGPLMPDWLWLRLFARGG